MKKGFTLIELLAVIVILGIILGIAVPTVLNIIEKSTYDAFQKDAQLLLKAIKVKMVSDDNFDPTTINESNISTLLEIDSKNYSKITVTNENNNLHIIIVGKNEWQNLIATNTGTNIKVDKGLLLWLDAGNKTSYTGTGTTWYDLSGNGYNASIYGTNTWVPEDGGKFDFGDIDQITNYISLPAAASQRTNESYTLEFWMQPVTSSNTGYFSSMASINNANYFLMQQSPTLIKKWNTPGGDVSYNSNEILQFVIVRNNNDTGKFYKNGFYVVDATDITKINEVSNGGWILNQEQDTIGGAFVPTEAFNGAFMIVKLYNRALSEKEIKENFEVVKNRYGL